MDIPNPLFKRDASFSWIGRGKETMRLEDVINKIGILLVLCSWVGTYSWTHPALHGPLILIDFIGGLIITQVGTAKPTTTSFTAPQN